MEYWASMKAAQWLVIGVPILWMVISTFLTTGFKIKGLAQNRVLRSCHSVWGLGVAWMCLVAAWVLLTYFTSQEEGDHRFSWFLGITSEGSDRPSRWRPGCP